MLKSNFSGFSLEVGTDEAGRGCLSGPVVAAAVILPKDFTHPFLNDSKQLSEKKREELRPFIEENAIAFGVSFVWQEERKDSNIWNKLSFDRKIDSKRATQDRLLLNR